MRACTSLRTGPGASRAPFDRFNLGARCDDDPDAVLTNRGALRSALDLPEPPRWLRQVHGRSVAIDPDRDEPEADAAVTSVAGSVLAVLTADCLPVLLCADDGSEVAAAHAGWRGLAAGVLEATVSAMRTSPDRVLAWLGPAAGPQAYEVGEEVREAFLSSDKRNEFAFVARRQDHWLVDLYALARRRLDGAGVERVYGGSLCTISDAARFYSHRRDGRTGRMASLIWREHVPDVRA